MAGRQWGVVTRAQLEESGLEKAGVSRWLRERRLHRVHPGVYAVGHPALGWEGKLAAALLYAGPGAALCGVTAAARLESDHRRDLALRAAGYTVLRYTWHQVTRTPDRVMADLEGAAQLARERGDRHGEQHREEDDRPGRPAAAALAEVEQR